MLILERLGGQRWRGRRRLWGLNIATFLLSLHYIAIHLLGISKTFAGLGKTYAECDADPPPFHPFQSLQTAALTRWT